MVFSTRTVLRIRFVSRLVLRVFVVYLLYRFAESLVENITNLIGVSRGSAGDFGWFLEQLLFTSLDVLVALLPMAALLAVDRWLLPWLVPAPAWSCPKCSHPLPTGNDPKCGECGTPHDAVAPAR